MIHNYNFKPQFAAPILAGTKIHTIRACRKDGRVPKQGDTLKLFVGLRGKGPATVIGQFPCVTATGIVIHRSRDAANPIIVSLGGKLVRGEALERLAVNDGFADLKAFAEYFSTQATLPMIGHLIVWVPVEY